MRLIGFGIIGVAVAMFVLARSRDGAACRAMSAIGPKQTWAIADAKGLLLITH
jgi:hypothetical protein